MKYRLPWTVASTGAPSRLISICSPWRTCPSATAIASTRSDSSATITSRWAVTDRSDDTAGSRERLTSVGSPSPEFRRRRNGSLCGLRERFAERRVDEDALDQVGHGEAGRDGHGDHRDQ